MEFLCPIHGFITQVEPCCLKAVANPITFEKFQNSKRYVEDLSRVVGGDIDDNSPGYIYLDDYYIFDMRREEEGDGCFMLTIFNEEFPSEDLEELEKKLYDFAAGDTMRWVQRADSDIKKLVDSLSFDQARALHELIDGGYYETILDHCERRMEKSIPVKKFR